MNLSESKNIEFSNRCSIIIFPCHIYVSNYLKYNFTAFVEFNIRSNHDFCSIFSKLPSEVSNHRKIHDGVSTGSNKLENLEGPGPLSK